MILRQKYPKHVASTSNHVPGSIRIRTYLETRFSPKRSSIKMSQLRRYKASPITDNFEKNNQGNELVITKWLGCLPSVQENPINLLLSSPIDNCNHSDNIDLTIADKRCSGGFTVSRKVMLVNQLLKQLPSTSACCRVSGANKRIDRINCETVQ